MSLASNLGSSSQTFCGGHPANRVPFLRLGLTPDSLVKVNGCRFHAAERPKNARGAVRLFSLSYPTALRKRYAYFLSLILPFYESHAGDPFDFDTRRDKPSSAIVHLKFDVMRGGPPAISILQEETPPPPPFLSFSMPEGGIRPALPLTMISTP